MLRLDWKKTEKTESNLITKSKNPFDFKNIPEFWYEVDNYGINFYWKESRYYFATELLVTGWRAANDNAWEREVSIRYEELEKMGIDYQQILEKGFAPANSLNTRSPIAAG